MEDERVRAMLETQRGAFKVSKAVEKLRLPDVGILDYIKKEVTTLPTTKCEFSGKKKVCHCDAPQKCSLLDVR